MMHRQTAESYKCNYCLWVVGDSAGEPIFISERQFKWVLMVEPSTMNVFNKIKHHFG